jgi:hypothetical protein
MSVIVRPRVNRSHLSVTVRPRVNRSHLSVTVRPRVNRSHLSVIVRPRVNRSNKWAAAAHTFFANTTIALNKQQMCVCVTRKKTDSYTGLSMKRTNESSSVPHTSSHSKLSAHGCLSLLLTLWSQNRKQSQKRFIGANFIKSRTVNPLKFHLAHFGFSNF